MSAYPRITIVTPSYNQGQFIEATIQSVMAQDYPNPQYIVIDGGSDDGTVSILQEYDGFITHWVSEPDAGQADAINKGFRLADGEIMGWLNSDDLLEDGALHRVGAHFRENPACDVVTGLRRIIDERGAWVRNELLWLPDSDVIRRGGFIPQEATFWRRDVWERVGALDVGLQFAMDYDYWQRMLSAGYRFDFMPAYLGKFRDHEAAKSVSATDTRARDLATIYQREGVADHEADALRQLNSIIGADWRHKQLMLKEYGQRRVSDDAERYVQYFHLLNTPLVGTLLVKAHRWMNGRRGRPVYGRGAV